MFYSEEDLKKRMIRYNSKLGATAPACFTLYTFASGFNGRCILHIPSLASLYNRSEHTIIRWVKDCNKLGLFRDGGCVYNKEQNTYTVYLKKRLEVYLAIMDDEYEAGLEAEMSLWDFVQKSKDRSGRYPNNALKELSVKIEASRIIPCTGKFIDANDLYAKGQSKSISHVGVEQFGFTVDAVVGNYIFVDLNDENTFVFNWYDKISKILGFSDRTVVVKQLNQLKKDPGKYFVCVYQDKLVARMQEDNFDPAKYIKLNASGKHYRKSGCIYRFEWINHLSRSSLQRSIEFMLRERLEEMKENRIPGYTRKSKSSRSSSRKSDEDRMNEFYDELEKNNDSDEFSGSSSYEDLGVDDFDLASTGAFKFDFSNDEEDENSLDSIKIENSRSSDLDHVACAIRSGLSYSSADPNSPDYVQIEIPNGVDPEKRHNYIQNLKNKAGSLAGLTDHTDSKKAENMILAEEYNVKTKFLNQLEKYSRHFKFGIKSHDLLNLPVNLVKELFEFSRCKFLELKFGVQLAFKSSIVSQELSQFQMKVEASLASRDSKYNLDCAYGALN